VVVTEAAQPTPTKAAALRRLGLSEKGTSTVVLEQVLRGTGQPNGSSESAVLEAFEDGEMGIRGVAPTGWRVLGPGIRARDKATRIVQRTKAGGRADELAAESAALLGLAFLPDNAKRRRTSVLDWDLYAIRVEAPDTGTILVDLALAESEGAAYVVLLQSVAEEHESLYEGVFLPVVDALEPLS
jgi:hypothetical protein